MSPPMQGWLSVVTKHKKVLKDMVALGTHLSTQDGSTSSVHLALAPL